MKHMKFISVAQLMRLLYWMEGQYTFNIVHEKTVRLETNLRIQFPLLHALMVAHEATTKMRLTHLRVPGPQADRGTTAGHTLAEALIRTLQRATTRERFTH